MLLKRVKHYDRQFSPALLLPPQTLTALTLAHQHQHRIAVIVSHIFAFIFVQREEVIFIYVSWMNTPLL